MIDFYTFTKIALRMLEDLCKLIVAKGFKKLPKVQKIRQSGHTADDASITLTSILFIK